MWCPVCLYALSFVFIFCFLETLFLFVIRCADATPRGARSMSHTFNMAHDKDKGPRLKSCLTLTVSLLRNVSVCRLYR